MSQSWVARIVMKIRIETVQKTWVEHNAVHMQWISSQVRFKQKEALTRGTIDQLHVVRISHFWKKNYFYRIFDVHHLTTGALLDIQFKCPSFLVRRHGPRPAGFAQNGAVLSKCFDPSGNQVLLRRLSELLSVLAELAKKLNARVPQRFPRNDGLDTERFLLNCPHGRVKQMTPNQNDKWCIDKLMILWQYADVYPLIRGKRI